jgi:hypothetical protein
VKEHGAPTDVLADGVEYAVKLIDRYRLVVFNWKVKVVDAIALALDRKLGQRHDRRDAVRIADR